MGVLAAVAGGLQFAGGVFQGVGARQEALADASLAGTEARLARLAAEDALRRGHEQAGQVRQQASQMIGQQQAVAGASGLDLSSSPVTTAATTTRAFSEMDAQTLLHNAALEAWGLNVQSEQHKFREQQAKQRAAWAPWGHILGGTAQAAMSFSGGGAKK